MIDLIVFCINIVMISIYYLLLLIRSRKAPDATVQSFNSMIRKQWVGLIKESGNKDILAIQTLRNSMMAANFMASTSVLLIIGALNLSDKIGNWGLDQHILVPPEYIANDLWQLKLGLLLLDFFIAFFSFSMSIRFFNHVGYMINLPCDPVDNQKMFQRCYTYLNKAGGYYAFGNRAFYFSLPIIMWFFGIYFFLLGTVTLIIGLVILDQPPR